MQLKRVILCLNMMGVQYQKIHLYSYDNGRSQSWKNKVRLIC